MDQAGINQPTITGRRDAWALACEWILRIEGGYVNDPSDPGGATHFGISKRSYPLVDIEGLTPDAAAVIYRRDFWTAVSAYLLPPALAIAVFDAAVNQGQNRAVMLLQMSLGVAADGIIGPATINAARTAPPEVLHDYLSRRAVHYAELSEQSPAMRRFRRGWFKRLFQLQAVCLSALEVRT